MAWPVPEIVGAPKLPWDDNLDVCENCGSGDHDGDDCTLDTNPSSLYCDECVKCEFEPSTIWPPSTDS